MTAGVGRVAGSIRKTRRMRAKMPMCQFPTVPRPSWYEAFVVRMDQSSTVKFCR